MCGHTRIHVRTHRAVSHTRPPAYMDIKACSHGPDSAGSQADAKYAMRCGGFRRRAPSIHSHHGGGGAQQTSIWQHTLRTLSHSRQARHRCELARASTIKKKNFATKLPRTTLRHVTGAHLKKNLNKTSLSHSRQARHRCELARASTITGTPFARKTKKELPRTTLGTGLARTGTNTGTKNVRATGADRQKGSDEHAGATAGADRQGELGQISLRSAS